LDLLEKRRTIIIEHLWREKVLEFVGWQTTREVADGVGIPSGSAKQILEDLQLVGILNKRLELTGGKDEEDSEGRGRKPYQWQIRQAAENWIRDSGVLDDHHGGDRIPF
jgi:predicted ArsR family transcriptional regulator